MKENITYGECLSDILGALSLKSSKLAREINIDSSLIYKWLRNERVPSYESPYIDLILNRIAKKLTNHSQKNALIEVLSKYDIQLLESSDACILDNLKLILQNSQGYSISLHNKIKSQNKLYRSRISCAANSTENIDASSTSVNHTNSVNKTNLQCLNPIKKENLSSGRDNVQIVRGSLEVLHSMINLLKKTPKSYHPNDAILLTVNNDLKLLSDINDLNNLLIQTLSDLLSSGWEIIIMIKLDNNVNRTIKIIEGVQSLLAIGNLRVYYHKRNTDYSNDKELCIIPKTGSLLSFSTHQRDQNDSAFIFHSKQSIEMWTAYFFQDLTSATPLLKSYPSQNSVELQKVFAESEETLGDKYVFKGGLSTITMPLCLYEKYLRLSGVTDQELSYRLFLHRKRLDAFAIQVKYFKFKDICFIESLEELIYKKKYSNDENYILKNSKPDYNDIIYHLENLVHLLQQYDNYEIAFVNQEKYSHMSGIHWMLKVKDRVLIETYKKNFPHDSFHSEMNFIITEKVVVNAFHDYFLLLWDNIPDKNKNKTKSITYLKFLIKKCRRLMD